MYVTFGVWPLHFLIFDFFIRCTKLKNILRNSLYYRKFIINLHAEWFISLLKPTHCEILEGVDFMTEVQSALLSDPEGGGGNKGLPADLREGCVSGRRVNQQLTVQRKH